MDRRPADAPAAPGSPWHLPAAFALLALALHAACGARYGVFRDELYFLACGERLAWGYVDQPPGIAPIARLAHALAGTSVVGLRVLPWLASSVTVLLTGRLARALGGGAAAAAIACAAAFAAPILLALGHLLTMNAFEPTVAVALALVLLALVRGADRRLWLLAGVLAAAGVLLKYTFALLAVATFVALLATPARRSLRTRWALLGAGVALLLVLPNFLWQARHGFPFLELARNGLARKNAPFTFGAFAKDLLLMAHPLAAPVWLGGLAWLLSSRAARAARFLGVGAALFLALLVATHGKAYYTEAALPILFAAGGVAWERVLRPRWARAASAAALTAGGLAFAPLAIPLLPVETFVRYQAAVGQRPQPAERTRYGVLPQHFADQHGWPELTRAVAGVYRALPPDERERAGIFAQNYGEAAAIDLYGPALGLPPAASGHNSYFLWGPPSGRGDPLIVIGDEEEDCGRAYREKIRAGTTPVSPWVMPYESGRTIWICRGATRPVEAIWPSVRLYI